MLLVTGEGGQGKTRLAREFLTDTQRGEWITGFLRRSADPAGDGDGGFPAGGLREYVGRVRRSSKPVLIVADYAETNPNDIAVLADLAEEPPARMVRVLLLARSAGDWWTNLTNAWSAVTDLRRLGALTKEGRSRREAYAAAVKGLAEHLARLPEPPVPGVEASGWRALAERLSDAPRDLDDDRLGNALTLQITALTDLLAEATGEERPPLGEGGRACLDPPRTPLFTAGGRPTRAACRGCFVGATGSIPMPVFVNKMPYWIGRWRH